jgi:hypothetical protein
MISIYLILPAALGARVYSASNYFFPYFFSAQKTLYYIRRDGGGIEHIRTRRFIIHMLRILYYYYYWPPLWSSDQSSWLQIRRLGFDSRHYQKKSSGSGTGSTQPREYN